MRTRLIFSFILIVLVSITGVVLIARTGAASEVRAFMYQGGKGRLDDLKLRLEEYYQAHNTWEGVGPLLENPSSSGQGNKAGLGQGGQGNSGGLLHQSLRLADVDGNVIADNQQAPEGKLSNDELSLAIPLEVNQETVGYLFSSSSVIFTTSDETFLVSRLSRAAMVAGLIAGGISLLLAIYLTYQLCKPVRELTNAAQRLAQGDLTGRVKATKNDEIGQLGRTFNQMAESLQKAQDSRRAMTADIAHELRTPLAVQRANLEALADGIYPLTVENLNPILEQNHLLNRLVEDLRTLALADAGQLQLEKIHSDLAKIVENVAEHFKPKAAIEQIEIVIDKVGNDYMTWVDVGRIEQIVNNLLSNALRYTPRGGRVEISMVSTPDLSIVSVHDSGEGIPPEALPHVFERFYRADRSRSRMEGGSGLGLAIARQLAVAHGGNLKAENHPLGGAVLILSLPRQGRKEQ
jgi:two-component system sensor histidine kinase BaeS